MTQYMKQNLNGASTLWVIDAECSKTNTTDGTRWRKPFGSGSQTTFWDMNLELDYDFNRQSLTRIPQGTRVGFSGIQIRNNDADSIGLSFFTYQFWGVVNGDVYFINAGLNLSGVYFPVGKWVTLPNTVMPGRTQNYGLYDSTIGNLKLRTLSGIKAAGFDYTIRNVNLYDLPSIPDDALLDAGDAGFSSAVKNDSLTVVHTADDPNEQVNEYLWSYGNGSTYRGAADGVARKRTVIYPSAGIYTVKNTAFNHKTIYNAGDNHINDQFTVTQQVQVPSGTFSADFFYESSYLDVDVEASPSVIDNLATVPVTYTWDWGDGTTSTGKFSSHSYVTGGDYPVKLTISNALGQSSSKTRTVDTEDIPRPSVNFTVDKTLLQATFTPTSTGGTYFWQFGDGSTSNVRVPTKIYETPGKYVVTLTYTPPGLAAVSVTKDLMITAEYTPIETYLDALRFEIELAPEPGVLYNYAKNPNGEQGGYGWLTPTATGVMRGSRTEVEPDDKFVPNWKLIYKSQGAAAQFFTTEYTRMNPGQYVNATYQVPYIDGFYRQSFEFYTQQLTKISESTLTPYLEASGSAKRATPALAPANTFYVVAKFYHYGNNVGAFPIANGVMQLRRFMLSFASTSAALANISYTEANNWFNILGDTFDLKVNREELDTGVLQALVRNGDFDPSKSQYIRPGRLTRLRAATRDDAGELVYENLYRGQIEKAVVNYDRFEYITTPANAGSPATLLYTNYALNPRAVSSGSLTEYNARWSWTRSFLTNVTGHPLGLTTAARFTAPAAVTGSGRGVDIYGNYDVASYPTTQAVTAGETIVVYEFVKWSLALSTQMSLKFHNGSAWVGGIVVGDAVSAPANEWVMVSVTVEVPAGATYMTGRLSAPGNVTFPAGATQDVSGLMIDKGSSQQRDYIDGAMADDADYDYAWVGTANNSRSTLTRKAVLASPEKYEAVEDPSRVVITIAARDIVKDMANTAEPRGMYRIVDLPFIMEGKGVPYQINGSSDQITTAQIVSLNDNASVLDQIVITRDSELAYAFVNRNNVFCAFDLVVQPTALSAIFDEGDYSDIRVDFDTESCINSVLIKWLRYTPATVDSKGVITPGSTEEIDYGPYVNQESIDEWGLHHEEFVMHGIVENPMNIEGQAQDILDRNSIPTVKVYEIAVPIVNEEDITLSKAVVDLYDKVNVKYQYSDYDEELRVTGIAHVITNARWDMRLTFSVDGTVASPQTVPQPPVALPVIPAPPLGSQSGLETIPASGTNPVTVSRYIKFPKPYTEYTKPPNVSVSTYGPNPNNVSASASVPTAAGFTMYLTRNSGNASNLSAGWTAAPDIS